MGKKEIQTEEKIFNAAAEVFTKKGYDGTRMQEIADHAGINKALLHYYYRSKEKLFTAVFTQIAKRMFKKIMLSFSDPNLNLEEKITLFYNEHITLLLKNPRLPAFVINEINKNPKLIKQLFSGEEFSRALSLLKKQYTQEVQKGKFQYYDPFNLFINIMAMSVFPFAARGIVEFIWQQEGIDFKNEMEKRKIILPEFVLNAIKKQGK